MAPVDSNTSNVLIVDFLLKCFACSQLVDVTSHFVLFLSSLSRCFHYIPVVVIIISIFCTKNLHLKV